VQCLTPVIADYVLSIATMDLTIRKATADDAAAAWTIRNAAIRHACKGFYAEDLLERWTAGEMTDEFVAFVAQQFYVATVNGVVVGTGLVDLGDGRLDAIFVRPDLMGRGIGRRIVAFCENIGRSAGLTELKLDSTLNAAPFYRRCGFVGDAIGVYRSPRGISLECLPMTKRVKDKGTHMNQAYWIGVLIGVSGAFCQAAEPSAAVIPPLPTEDRPLAERFTLPPPSARILRIVHAQNDNPAAQDQQLRTLAAQGFGGFAGNVAFDGYVDDDSKWPAFLRGVRLAKAAGMSLWLYDECGYPSGSARDLTLRGHPEWAARGLLVAEATATGGLVSLALPPGQLVLAAALPLRSGAIVLDDARDLTAAVASGRISWHAPAGEWLVVAMTDDLIYEGTHAAISLAYKKPCIDLLTPEPTARFLEVTHARYAERLGSDLGQYFVSTFTDEPSLQNYWFRPMPYRVLPWSLTIEREFRQRRGRELRPLLPALVAEAGPSGARARYDFWNTVGELVAENYFGQIQTWCGQHKLLSGGHLLMEEGLVGHVPLYGHFFRCLRRLDAPSIDCLTSLPPQVPWHIARLIGSAADLESRTVTMCEVSDHSQRYRPTGDTRPIRVVTEDEIRGTCNRLIWGGINTLTSYYAFQDLTDEQLQRINTHAGRCQTMVRGGHQVTDIAVLYPTESVWPHFLPAHQGATAEPAARRVESVFESVSSALYGANRDFSYVDSQALREAKVADGTLALRDLRRRVVILPAAETLPLEAWENVAALWRTGGAVIAIGARPANSDADFPSPRVQEIARELFGTDDAPCVVTNPAGGAGVLLPTSMISLVPQIVDSLFERDAACVEQNAPIKITRRRIDEHEVYFAINDSEAIWEGTIRFCGRGPSEQWDPATGTMTPIADGTQVPVRLGPYGAMLFRSATADVPKRLSGTVAAALSLTCEPLPGTSKPAVSQGQFVQSELTGDDASGWRAAATLTKGQVDTFLFLNFAYTQPLNLTACAGLAIDASVPQGQRTNGELLVFLNTTNGDRFLASTGRYLNEPGSSRAYAMFSQFRAFGQTQGELDLSRIASVSVGWGGHIGIDGEQITFTVKPPQRFVCSAK
jgi:GNAT superfamily N-acetyltransferase